MSEPLASDSEDLLPGVEAGALEQDIAILRGQIDVLKTMASGDKGSKRDSFLDHVEKLAMPIIIAFIAMMADCRAQDFQKSQHDQSMAVLLSQQSEQSQRASLQLKLSVVDKINSELARGDESSVQRALAMVDLVDDPEFAEKLIDLIEEASFDLSAMENDPFIGMQQQQQGSQMSGMVAPRISDTLPVDPFHGVDAGFPFVDMGAPSFVILTAPDSGPDMPEDAPTVAAEKKLAKAENEAKSKLIGRKRAQMKKAKRPSRKNRPTTIDEYLKAEGIPSKIAK